MEKYKNIKDRTLSEEYNSRSPNTQYYIRTMAQAVPTSKSIVEITNTDIYYASSPTTRSNMESYGLVMLRPTHKK